MRNADLTCTRARGNSRLERDDSDSDSHSHAENCVFEITDHVPATFLHRFSTNTTLLV